MDIGHVPVLGAVNSAAMKCVGRDNFQVLLSILFHIFPEVGPGLFFIPSFCCKSLNLMVHNQKLPPPPLLCIDVDELDTLLVCFFHILNSIFSVVISICIIF